MSNTQQAELNKYFSSTWLERDRGFANYRYTGTALLDKIASNERVLDVGCGDNFFKPHLNVTGIDPANERADFKLGIEEFESDEKFDVAFCLGSLNFGDIDTIRRQIGCVVRLLKPKCRIYWRCNPGRHDHDNSEFESIAVFPWSFEYQTQLAKEFGFSINELEWDTNNRIYAEWRRG